jgi:Putative citrate transport
VPCDVVFGFQTTAEEVLHTLLLDPRFRHLVGKLSRHDRRLDGLDPPHHQGEPVFVFFIFLVANLGGSLTPLGDPPLFLGFLKGVDFLWTLEHMVGPMLFMSSLLLALFYVIDPLAWNRELAEVRAKSRVERQIRIENLLTCSTSLP